MLVANLGNLYKDQGDVQKAKQLYEDARGLGNTNAMSNLGILYEGEGDVQKAKQLYEEARGLGNANAMCNLGILYEGEAHELFTCIYIHILFVGMHIYIYLLYICSFKTNVEKGYSHLQEET